jgi:hypothetical protein
MVYKILAKSDKYTLDYSEEQNQVLDGKEYDFIVVNWHYSVNNWITKETLSTYTGKTYCIITEVGLDTLFTETHFSTPQIFDYYMFLDPSITDDPGTGIYGFPRPLEPYLNTNEQVNPEIITVGSFGFATKGKRWDLIIDAVSKEFDNAVIRFNIPNATYINKKIQTNTISKIQNKMTSLKPGIRVELTHTNMPKNELLKWCGANTINCFFYDRYTIGFKHGLCAVTDQAISSGKPVLTTNDPTFRHITKYLKPYPEISIKDALSQNTVSKMQEDWAPAAFLAKFESLLTHL